MNLFPMYMVVNIEFDSMNESFENSGIRKRYGVTDAVKKKERVT